MGDEVTFEFMFHLSRGVHGERSSRDPGDGSIFDRREIRATSGVLYLLSFPGEPFPTNVLVSGRGRRVRR